MTFPEPAKVSNNGLTGHLTSGTFLSISQELTPKTQVGLKNRFVMGVVTVSLKPSLMSKHKSLNANNASQTSQHIALVLILVFITASQTRGQTKQDPHRPACHAARCLKIKSFLKSHYCGASPYGNGPDDGCLIKVPTKPNDSVTVKADYKCDWDEQKQTTRCQQYGQPSLAVRRALVGELHRLGMPENPHGEIYYTVWESAKLGWTLAAADYSRQDGDSIELCEVLVILDANLQVTVLRQQLLQKTDADVSDVTQWSLLDIMDSDGVGRVEVVLGADAYEDHWLEVISVHDGTVQTVFSGLGYYL
jgi:hypothetical protein